MISEKQKIQKPNAILPDNESLNLELLNLALLNLEPGTWNQEPETRNQKLIIMTPKTCLILASTVILTSCLKRSHCNCYNENGTFVGEVDVRALSDERAEKKCNERVYGAKTRSEKKAVADKPQPCRIE